jgi:hypothetical protein
LVSAGAWVLEKLQNSLSLRQMSFGDYPPQQPRQAFLYQLSKQPGLEHFRHVVLFSSWQDHYCPFDSSRIEVSLETQNKFPRVEEEEEATPKSPYSTPSKADDEARRSTSADDEEVRDRDVPACADVVDEDEIAKGGQHDDVAPPSTGVVRNDLGSIYKEMARNILSRIRPERLVRLSVDFAKKPEQDRTLDGLLGLGRNAHLQFLENQTLMEILVTSYPEFF